ncbi:MAG: transglutaminase family protein [Dehalococcoidia bacterium]|nr:transglutaminase family protein [Dehalococcoidia bacterium]
MDSASLHEFAMAAAGRDSDVDLFGAALIVARLRAGPTDPNGCARELDLIAEAAGERAGDTRDPLVLAQAIDHELFVARGFHGNSENYADPENSYLDAVVARRTGLPITLSLVYMEVAQRIGLHCDGVGYPGNFIVRCGEPGDALYVDPFHQGARLDREELLAGLRGRELDGMSPDALLLAVTRRQILRRMLTNLYTVFRDKRDVERWLGVVELILRLEPWNATLVGERGMLHYRLGHPALALVDLERYVAAAAPGGVSNGALRLLEELRSHRGSAGDPA